jgi:hypothetical protein
MENKVKISVQGHYFLLPSKTVLSHDWLPKTMIETNLEKDKFDGTFYLDCNYQAFSVVYSILNGTLVEETLVQTTSNFEILLLISTADYLGCTHISKDLKDLHSDRRVKKDEITAKLAEARKILDLVKDVDDTIYCETYICKHSRKFRPRNICGEKVLLLANNLEQREVKCGVCDQPMKLYSAPVRLNVDVKKILEVIIDKWLLRERS